MRRDEEVEKTKGKMDGLRERGHVKEVDYPLTDDRNEWKNKSVVPTSQNGEERADKKKVLSRVL